MDITIKVITLAATLQEKTINLFEDRYYDGGSIRVEGAKIKCWKAGGHGSESYLEVVQNSCNLECKQEIQMLTSVDKIKQYKNKKGLNKSFLFLKFYVYN